MVGSGLKEREQRKWKKPVRAARRCAYSGLCLMSHCVIAHFSNVPNRVFQIPPLRLNAHNSAGLGRPCGVCTKNMLAEAERFLTTLVKTTWDSRMVTMAPWSISLPPFCFGSSRTSHTWQLCEWTVIPLSCSFIAHCAIERFFVVSGMSILAETNGRAYSHNGYRPGLQFGANIWLGTCHRLFGPLRRGTRRCWTWKRRI